jgi:hypothetical protein
MFLQGFLPDTLYALLRVTQPSQQSVDGPGYGKYDRLRLTQSNGPT